VRNEEFQILQQHQCLWGIEVQSNSFFFPSQLLPLKTPNTSCVALVQEQTKVVCVDQLLAINHSVDTNIVNLSWKSERVRNIRSQTSTSFPCRCTYDLRCLLFQQKHMCCCPQCAELCPVCSQHASYLFVRKWRGICGGGKCTSLPSCPCMASVHT
jgi:hypothetical protein